jgi:hypothetical protein
MGGEGKKSAFTRDLSEKSACIAPKSQTIGSEKSADLIGKVS